MNMFASLPLIVPVDFSDECDRAVDAATQIASSPTNITLVHVLPPLGEMEPLMAYAVDDAERTESILGAFAHRFADPKYRGVNFHVSFGDAGHEICAFAKEKGAGLIVMPSHGRTGLAHLLIGSVAERVVRFAPCPVLVLRA